MSEREHSNPGELAIGTTLRNKYGGRFQVLALDEDGVEAEIIDGGKTGGEGSVVWLDGRDIGPGKIEVES